MTKRVLSPGYKSLISFYKSPQAVNSSSGYNTNQTSLETFNYEEEVVNRHEEGDIEEDVLDLSIQVQQLQHTIGLIAENQISTDDMYVRARHDNAGLNNRILMLEEQARELEGKGEERVEDEQKRNADLLTRIERIKNLEIENYVIRLQNMEKENKALEIEVNSLKSHMERITGEKESIKGELEQAHALLTNTHEKDVELKEIQNITDCEWKKRKIHESNSILVTKDEVTSGIRREKTDRELFQFNEIQDKIRRVKEENKQLVKENEELQTLLLTKQVKEGQNLLAGQQKNITRETEDMNNEQLRNAFAEQKDLNRQLHDYIDHVLVNIMERYPELLEIRRN